MANEKTLPSNDTLINGQPHDANLIRANDEYLRDTIWVDASEPTGPNVHRGMIWIDTSVTPHAIKIRLVSSWATITVVEKLLYGIDANKGATPDPGDLYIATDTGKIYACFTDDAWETIYTPTFPSGAYTNILANGGFEIWQRGAGPFTADGYNADMWKQDKNGTSTITVTREGTEKISGLYSMKIVYTHNLNSAIRQFIENFEEYRGKTVTFSMWVKCDTASAALLRIDDGVGTSSSDFHTGDNAWQKLTTTLTLDNSASDFQVFLRLSASATIYIDNAMLTISDKIVDYTPLNIAEDWDRCLRYYERLGTSTQSAAQYGYVGAALQWIIVSKTFLTTKASTPTETIHTTASGNLNDVRADNKTTFGYILQTQGIAAGYTTWVGWIEFEVT
jgi:hypothetical protein